MKGRLRTLFSFVMLCALQNSADAQNWKVVPLPNIYSKVIPYFLNEKIGFVFDGNTGAIQTGFRRTTDGGTTWTVLRYFDNVFAQIKQLYFTSINRGYAAASDGVYETSDTGNTWRNIYQSQEIIGSVYAFGGKVFAFAGSGSTKNVSWGPLIKTENDGKTWDTIIAPTPYVANNTYRL